VPSDPIMKKKKKNITWDSRGKKRLCQLHHFSFPDSLLCLDGYWSAV